ncbi:hypothetical protein, partial [Staphylococcus aureus]|uniref:hypothetical protein n=1 Tax=Staphylococcus aureus TaxID=1280 RepID=UPI00338DAD7F
LVARHAPTAEEEALLRLLELRAGARRALDDAGDAEAFAARLCTALAGWPGVLHAALYRHRDGDLHLE